ncbi:peptidoglycan-associated lipoprotein Pal [Silanimonas sp.]|uniref:peptidoglycan-associated lipoprotein Pal n=1 Tax=Silanimonas sp. TaxID=1929290 RepID=UPI001BC7DFED|nr:peptidoglycan-associated lipoprotein Pal [Silanimonas sp.]MBS3895301.1 peptidoglycan-associated lipoprotein Pal [Silanimonas sp.]MBS3923715.1 peptidoglycan-associated lipoprotein Pal [Xanthomonadaceae bacterium]
MNNTVRLALVAACAIVLSACARQVREEPQPAPVAQVAAPAAPAVADGRFGPQDLDTNPCLMQRTVLFDFDMATIRPEFQAIMACHARYLQDRPEARVTLEGHADERGSREYNLALGERRGNAVMGALQAAGGSAGQLTVVSFGEERPTCTASTESCWQQNRRVEIVYTAR